MSVTTEPEIQTVSVVVSYAALINTPQTDTLLAAPGAGVRYRVYGASMAPVQNGTVCNLRFAITGAFGIYRGTFANPTGGIPIWFPQGIPADANAAINLTTTCTVAGTVTPIVCTWTLYYVQEAV